MDSFVIAKLNKFTCLTINSASLTSEYNRKWSLNELATIILRILDYQNITLSAANKRNRTWYFHLPWLSLYGDRLVSTNCRINTWSRMTDEQPKSADYCRLSLLLAAYLSKNTLLPNAQLLFRSHSLKTKSIVITLPLVTL